MEENIKDEKGKRAILFFPKLFLKLLSVNKKILVILLVVLSIAATIIVARTKPELLGIPVSQQIVESETEVNKLIEEVGKIIELPEGPKPTIATVTEVEKVKGQAFFAKAQNGDKVLVYTEAKKAILYRPSEKKIIEVGVVNIGQEEASSSDGNIDNSEEETESVTPTPTLKPTSTMTPTSTIKPTPTFILTPTSVSTPTPTIAP